MLAYSCQTSCLERKVRRKRGEPRARAMQLGRPNGCVAGEVSPGGQRDKIKGRKGSQGKKNSFALGNEFKG
jgi:hypothetical protein